MTAIVLCNVVESGYIRLTTFSFLFKIVLEKIGVLEIPNESWHEFFYFRQIRFWGFDKDCTESVGHL